MTLIKFFAFCAFLGVLLPIVSALLRIPGWLGVSIGLVLYTAIAIYLCCQGRGRRNSDSNRDDDGEEATGD